MRVLGWENHPLGSKCFGICMEKDYNNLFPKWIWGANWFENLTSSKSYCSCGIELNLYMQNKFKPASIDCEQILKKATIKNKES